MSFFKGKYLRVLSPRTTDGSSPMLNERGTLIYKEEFLPLSARRDLELQNKYLPDILKKKIQEVDDGDDEQVAVSGKEAKVTGKK